MQLKKKKKKKRKKDQWPRQQDIGNQPKITSKRTKEYLKIKIVKKSVGQHKAY